MRSEYTITYSSLYMTTNRHAAATVKDATTTKLNIYIYIAP